MLAVAVCRRAPPNPGISRSSAASSLRGCTFGPGQAVYAFADQAIDAEERDEILDTDDRHIDETVELALRVYAELSCADDDDVGFRQAQRLDFDPAVGGGLQFAEARGPRLRRQILQPSHHRVDFTLDRFCKYRMERRRNRPVTRSVI